MQVEQCRIFIYLYVLEQHILCSFIYSGRCFFNYMYIKQIGKISLTPPLFIKVPVPGHESACSCVCLFGISILPISTIFLWNVRTITTPRHFFFFVCLLINGKLVLNKQMIGCKICVAYEYAQHVLSFLMLIINCPHSIYNKPVLLYR